MLQSLRSVADEDSCAPPSQELASIVELPGRAGAVISWLSEDGLRLVFRWLPEGQECRASTLKLAESDERAAISLAWLLDLGANGNPLLCVGFAHGGVTLFTHDACVLFSFLVSPTPVIRIRHSSPRQFVEDATQTSTGGGRLMLLHEHGRLVVIESESIPEVAAAVLLPEQEHPLEALRFSVYDLRGRAAIIDAAILSGARFLEDPFALKRREALCAVALGSQPFLSLHGLRQTASSAGQRTLLGSAASALGSYARSWVSSRNSTSHGYPEHDRQGVIKIAGFAAAHRIQVSPSQPCTELPVAAKFIDASRQGEVLMPAPFGSSDSTRLAATCDAYGRVALFCLESLRCIHLWKGYRDAQVSWLAPLVGPGKALAGQGLQAADKACAGLDLPGLAIYAPRRGLLELWHLWSSGGPKRLAARCVGSDCMLLSQGGCAYLLWNNGKLDRVVWPACGATSTGGLDPDSDAFDSADSNGDAC